MANAPILSVTNLSYRIREHFILQSVNCELNAGEVLAVVGPNGAGKSTLLRLLTNDLPALSGEIRFAGRVIDQWSLAERAKYLAVLPQSNSLHFPFSVEEVIALGRTPHVESSRLSQQVVHEVMAQCDLEHLAAQHYTALSGGEQQRVQLARVLAQIWGESVAPRLVILDEPSTALDFFHQRILLSSLQQLSQQGVAVLLITHDINLACKCATQLLGLKAGRVHIAGAITDVITEANLSSLYDTPIRIIADPIDGVSPCVVGL